MKKEYISVDEIKTILGVPYDEQETCITYMHNEKIAQISTNDNSTITKLKKRMQASPNDYKCFIRCNKENIDNYFFEVPKKLISFRASKPKRELTEEQKKAFSERARKIFTKKKENEE